MSECTICDGSHKVQVGWSPVNNLKIRLEYDPCPNCTPGPHGFYAKQAAERIRARVDAAVAEDGDNNA